MSWAQRIIRLFVITNVFCVFVAGSTRAYARDDSLPSKAENSGSRPIVIVSIDKADSLELWNSELPSLKKLISTSACGLMNIRSNAGYGNTGGGYLTVGSGSRATMPGILGGTFEKEEALPGGTADQYLAWTYGFSYQVAFQKESKIKTQLGIKDQLAPIKDPFERNLVSTAEGNSRLKVPEVGWINNQALTEDHPVEPGSLGAIFKGKGWRTCLLGGQDTPLLPNRPGGLLLMDHQGLIDEGAVNSTLAEQDPGFPYQTRFSTAKTMNELQNRLVPKKIFLIEFGDFARLDAYQNEILPAQFQKLKELTWIRFDQFIGQMLDFQKSNPFSFIVLSPSISKEGISRKNLLAPIIINTPGYQPGLLTSGTTKWPGLVANIDILPTMVKLAGFQFISGLPGRVIAVKLVANLRQELKGLNERLIGANTNQRTILDWYMGIIAGCWIGAFLFLFMKRERLSELLLTGLLVIPLILIGLPLLPVWSWSLFGFLGFTLALTSLFSFIKPLDKRIMVLSGLLWSVLILDQMLGWRLIRYSPLGYSAMAGSRYYGMGNEFMGVFLAVALTLSYLICQKTGFKWPSLLIAGLTISVLSLPQLGAKFGGILAGSVGFTYYLIKLYQVEFNNRKLWLSLSGFIVCLALVGWWDSLRPPEIQTHIGRFIRLFFNKDFGQVGQIIWRKLEMNLKLTVNSPWIRIVILAFVLGIIYRAVSKVPLAGKENGLVWSAILVTGFMAYLVNDAGVLAFATCLAYGFSFILLQLTKDLKT